VLLAGEPIIEPVSVQEGFAMNTPEEVITAMQEYRANRLGSVQPESEAVEE
jgi:redox-sensitive bicupin YhaK (pirin superfamily)